MVHDEVPLQAGMWSQGGREVSEAADVERTPPGQGKDYLMTSGSRRRSSWGHGKNLAR